MEQMSKAVGLVGVGLMGTALARRLVGAGFEVVGFDVDPQKGVALEALGGRSAGSVAEVGRRCRRVFVAVLTIDQVEEVIEGEGGLLAVPPDESGRRVALCVATSGPERVAALAGRAARRGLTLLDAPVSGSSVQVARGDGVGLIGGDPAAAEDTADLLDVVYPRRFFVGAAGDASKAKLALNLVLGLNRVALAEGLVFAENLGLEPQTLLDIARNSAAYSQVMDVKGEKMVRADYTPQGKIGQNLKDVRIMLDEAARCGQGLPSAQLLADLLQACVDRGEGERDNCAVIEEIRRRRSN
jgi:3-hydroxyisobutyrate dehydrogenase-like beta-hydroxyacid dehydrogenase